MDKENNKDKTIIITPSDLDRDLITMYFISKEHKKREIEESERKVLTWMLTTLLTIGQILLIAVSSMDIFDKIFAILLGIVIWILYTQISEIGIKQDFVK